MDQSIIFILDDDENILEILQLIIMKNSKKHEVYTFINTDAMLMHPKISNVDLFIIDVNLKGLNGKEVCNILLNKFSNFTSLFISGTDYDFESFADLGCVYDFIQKPFSIPILMNRIKTLTLVSEELKKRDITKKKIELSLIDLFDYSDVYLLILDINLNIRLCSYKLSKDLGFSNTDDILGMNWEKFLPPEMIYTKKLFGISESKFHEFTTDIQDLNGKRISTKWFNTKIINGTTLTFGIGLPLTTQITKEDSIEKIRQYWEEVIQKNNTTVNIFKELLRDEDTSCIRNYIEKC